MAELPRPLEELPPWQAWWWLDRQILSWWDKFRPQAEAQRVREYLAERVDELRVSDQAETSTPGTTEAAPATVVSEATVQGWKNEADAHANAIAARIQKARDAREAAEAAV